MSLNIINNEDCKERPKVFIERIIFNDNTVLELDPNSIVVFTGANNSGKSQVLRDIELFVENKHCAISKVVKNCNIILKGSIIEEEFIKEHFLINHQGLYQMIESTNAFSQKQLIQFWNNSSEFYFIYNLFIHRLSTDERLTASRALNRAKPQKYNSIIKLYKSEQMTQSISNYFRQAFECDLVVNRNELTDIPLHVGKAPDKTLYTIDKQDDYYDEVEKLPKLDEQGDGMKSFATILLDTFTSNYPITLIDEPEAFLHPPQARILGKMLSKKNMNEIVTKRLNDVGLDSSVVDLYPHEFSGGQRQRIAIARALVLKPELIIADEPVSALDASIQAQIINLIKDLKQNLNLTFLFISHDLSVIRYISDRVAVMYLGEIVEIGLTQEIFNSPKHPYTAALLSAVPKIGENNIKMQALKGELPSPQNLPKGCKFHTRCPYAMDKCATNTPPEVIFSDFHVCKCFLYSDK